MSSGAADCNPGLWQVIPKPVTTRVIADKSENSIQLQFITHTRNVSFKYADYSRQLYCSAVESFPGRLMYTFHWFFLVQWRSLRLRRRDEYSQWQPLTEIMSFNKIASFFSIFLYFIKKYKIYETLKVSVSSPPHHICFLSTPPHLFPLHPATSVSSPPRPIWHIHFSAPRTVLLWAAAPLAPLSSVTVRTAVSTRGFQSLQNTRRCLGDQLKSNSSGCAIRADVWLIYI